MKPVKNLYLMVHALLNKEGDAPLDQPAKQSKSKQLVSKIQKDWFVSGMEQLVLIKLVLMHLVLLKVTQSVKNTYQLASQMGKDV
jgi:hypothetical protein